MKEILLIARNDVECAELLTKSVKIATGMRYTWKRKERRMIW